MKQLLIITFVFLSLAACKNNTTESSSESGKPSRDSLVHHIESLEKQLDNQHTIDYQFAGELVTAYMQFFNNYPKDDMAGDYLFKAADVSMNIKQSEKAIELFNKVVDAYPNNKKTPFALFLQGFIYETQLGNINKAKEVYQQVIDQYPNTRVAEDAKASIANLGKSDEELIKEFEAKNKVK